MNFTNIYNVKCKLVFSEMYVLVNRKVRHHVYNQVGKYVYPLAIPVGSTISKEIRR